MVVTTAALAVACVSAGIAIAAVTLPFSGDGNTINGCYNDKGKLVLLTPTSSQCAKKYHSIQWNVTGPQGAPGSPGAPGKDGVSPTVAQLAPGDTHCPNGGAAITDAANTTAYVCSGGSFDGTFTAGDYSISVTGSGITLAGPSNEKVTLTNSGITVDGGAAGFFKAKTGAAEMSFESASSLNLKGLITKVQAATLLDLTGALTRIGGGCLPVARVGDQIQGVSAGMGGPVTGTILTGSPTVLSC
jgi:hypothetical protein